MLETVMDYPTLALGTFWEFLRTDYQTRHPRSTFQTAKVHKFYEGVNTFLYMFKIKNILVMRFLRSLSGCSLQARIEGVAVQTGARNDNLVHFSEIST